MTEINQINNDALHITGKNKKTNIDKKDSNTFHQTFGKVLENMESSKMEIAATESLEEISVQNFKLPDQNLSVTRGTEKLLEMLELYASKIEDNSVSLKEIDSLLKDIQTDAEDLLEKVINSPEADEKVKSIAREFAVFASTEQIKFQRGDYLS